MARPRKQSLENQTDNPDLPQDIQTEDQMMSPSQVFQPMEFAQAYRIYKKNNSKIEWWDVDAVKAFATKKVNGNASYADWSEIFDKY